MTDFDLIDEDPAEELCCPENEQVVLHCNRMLHVVDLARKQSNDISAADANKMKALLVGYMGEHGIRVARRGEVVGDEKV